MIDGHKQFTGARWDTFKEKQEGLTCANDCSGCEAESAKKLKAAPVEQHPTPKKEKDHGKSHRR